MIENLDANRNRMNVAGNNVVPWGKNQGHTGFHPVPSAVIKN
jgi:hypothetical protein